MHSRGEGPLRNRPDLDPVAAGWHFLRANCQFSHVALARTAQKHFCLQAVIVRPSAQPAPTRNRTRPKIESQAHRKQAGSPYPMNAVSNPERRGVAAFTFVELHVVIRASRHGLTPGARGVFAPPNSSRRRFLVASPATWAAAAIPSPAAQPPRTCIAVCDWMILKRPKTRCVPDHQGHRRGWREGGHGFLAKARSTWRALLPNRRCASRRRSRR